MASPYCTYNQLVKTGQVVSLESVKTWLKMDGITEDDMLINDLIKACSLELENNGSRLVLGSTTFEMYMDYFPEIIVIDRFPVTALTTVEYIAAGGSSYSTLASTEYNVDLTGGRIEIITAPGIEEQVNAVKVTFTAGYTEDTCPADVILALRLRLAGRYGNREDYCQKFTMAAEFITAGAGKWRL